MNTAQLFTGVVLSALGFGYFLYGKKQGSGLPLVCGAVLMGLPYFVSGAGWLAVAGLVVAAIPYFVRS